MSYLRCARWLSAISVSVVTMPVLGQQVNSIDAVLVEGDSVGGVGRVTRIDNLVVNNDGSWIVEADTDQSDIDADSVLIKNDILFLREGDPLPLPMGASVGSFDTLSLNSNDASVWNLFLDGTSGLSDNSGVYRNATLIIQESDISGAPEFSSGTPYTGFFECKFNDANQVLIMASIDDPNIPSTTDRALVIAQINDAGVLLGEAAPYKEGDILPGQVDPVLDFETGPHQFGFNSSGQIMFNADLGATGNAIYLDDVLLGQTGDSSPVIGRNYEFLTRSLDLNSVGDHVFRANLDGDDASDEIIVRNGERFVGEGDTFDAISPSTIDGLGLTTAPVRLTDSGNVIWYGEWNGGDDAALFYDFVPIIETGVTSVDGRLVDAIANTTDAFSVSENGRYVLAEVTFTNGDNAALMVDVTCLSLDVSPLIPNQNATFDVSGAQANTAGGVFFFLIEPDLSAYVSCYDACRDGGGLVSGCALSCIQQQLGFAGFATFVTDNSGAATVTRRVPPPASGRTVHVLAISLDENGEALCTSQVVTSVVQ